MAGRLWIALGIILFLSTFGVQGGCLCVLCLVSFISGIFAMLYYYGKSRAELLHRDINSLYLSPPSIGNSKLVEDVRKGQPAYRTDKRMTGANIIDEVLHEVLDYTYRDYIQTWYRKISDDPQFKYRIRHTLQQVIISFSERSKHVDLVPYITTRLMDEIASHIRLYRRALDKCRDHQRDDTKPPTDLESCFFDLEVGMEKHLCRDMVCMCEDSERQYLQDLCDMLLFLCLPPEDFHNKPFRYIVREVLVNGIFLPAINLLADPDYINQTISWLCKDTVFTSESFLTILKTTDNPDELVAVKEKVDTDIARQRSKDTGGEDDTVIKQQLGSLMFVKSICEERAQRLKDGVVDPDSLYGMGDLGKLVPRGHRLYSLPLDVVLNNNVALSYFIEFMTSVGSQQYLFFYLTIEGYRVSAEQQISAALLAEGSTEKPDLDMLKDAATSIYNQYLSPKATSGLRLDELYAKAVLESIENDEPSDTIFDSVQAKVWNILQDEPYFPAFKRSQLYIKLLAELDLLKDGNKSDDGALSQDEDGASSQSSSLQAELYPFLMQSTEDLASSCDSNSSAEHVNVSNSYNLSAEITNTGICREHGKAYAVYLITVTKKYGNGTEDVWDVYRRYSDFHDLHMTITEKFESLAGLALPSKKAFNNMSKEFLEKRKLGLNAYLQCLLNPGVQSNHPGLQDLVLTFLEHIIWEKEKSHLARKMDTFVNPLKNSMKNMGNMVKSMPDNFVDGMVKVSGGIRSLPNSMIDNMGKVLNVRALSESKSWQSFCDVFDTQNMGVPPGLKPDGLDSGKVGASLDVEEEDNIPLRIMLLLMDEVFDLKNRNMWLRRRIVAILRQIIKTMLGDSINRKILEHVEWMTSAEQVAEYIKAFRDNFWPNGILAEPRIARDDATKMRTRVACKAKLLGSMSEEVGHLLGNETTRQGVMRIFSMCQHHTLNKRLLYVILEGLLETLFPDNKFPEVFRKMHSRSQRVKDKVGSQS